MTSGGNERIHARAIMRERLAKEAIEERMTELKVARSNAASIRAMASESDHLAEELEDDLHEELVAQGIYQCQISALEALIVDNESYFDPNLSRIEAPRASHESTGVSKG